MAITSRRKRRLVRPPAYRDANLIIIATEGELTEKVYFEHLWGRERGVQVRILPTEEGRSAPRHVLSRLTKYKSENEIGKGDELWLMIDKDRWDDKQLVEVASQTRARRFSLAVSTPCFELWLYLHLGDPADEMREKPCPFFASLIRGILGSFDPANLNMAHFESNLDAAIRRARSLDEHPDERWPNSLGTRVYRVVESILGSKR